MPPSPSNPADPDSPSDARRHLAGNASADAGRSAEEVRFAGSSLSAEGALPPVEPPSAGFLVQLFVVPGVIVTVIAVGALLVSWIVQRGDNPRRYVEALQRPGPGRWQAASSLADALRGSQHDALKRDHEAAGGLARLLESEIDAGSMEETPITLRQFLCQALGKFQVADGLDALLRAATTQRDPREVHVRRAAIESLAQLADSMAAADPPEQLDDPRVVETLVTLAADDDEVIRSTAAFALGVVGGAAALDELALLLDDPNVDASYNAATGLARNGDLRALPGLEAMLDPDQQQALQLEGEEEMREFKQAMILINGLRAARQLAEQNRGADLGPLRAAAKRLTEAPVARQVRLEAAQTLHALAPQSPLLPESTTRP